MGKPKTKNAKPPSNHKKGELSPAEALAKFEKEGKKLDPSEVQPCHAEVSLAAANTRTAVLAVFAEAGTPERKELVAELGAALPALSVKKVLDLPDLSRALVLATQRVAPTTSSDFADKLGIVSKHREPMLFQAEVLAKKGLLDADRVAGIRAGKGKLDMAGDGIALVDLYGQNAAKLKGKHPFTAEDFAELHDASQWLIDNLSPAGARKAPEKPTAAIDLRDRLWTLMVARYSDLRVFGYYRFRDALDEHVPRLLSRVLGPREKAAEEANGGNGANGPTGPTGATGATGASAAGGGNGEAKDAKGTNGATPPKASAGGGEAKDAKGSG